MRKGCVCFLMGLLLLVLWVSAQFTGALAPAASQVLVLPDYDYPVMGTPTISAAFMNRVLAAYGSPAAGTGPPLYYLGGGSGVDPGYALAFFFHEDSFCKMGIGAAKHRLGQIRFSAGFTLPHAVLGFC